MLRRQDDLRHLGRLAILVAHRHLALGIGPELARLALARAPGLGQTLQDAVGIVDRRRHQVGRLAAGIAEHDALVARALLALAVGGIVHTLADVGRLAVQQNVDLRLLPVEAVLLVADVANRPARRRLELRGVDQRLARGVLQDVAVLVLLQKRVRNPDLAGDHDAVGRGQGLAGNPHLPRVRYRHIRIAPGILRRHLARLAVGQVDDLVRDAVAYLVGMAFRNRFTGKQIVLTRHGPLPLEIANAQKQAASRSPQPDALC